MSESELAHGVWTIPGSRTKNKREHEVPLPKAALDLIATLPRGSGLLLSTNNRTAISGFSKMKAQLDREVTRLNRGKRIPDWRLHDLRRTVRTGFAALGISREVAEVVINHRSGAMAGMVAVYDKHPYRAEKRNALAKWAEHVIFAVEALWCAPLKRYQVD